jgi:hypothetical protein
MQQGGGLHFFMMESQRIGAINPFQRESRRVPVQINHGSDPLIGNSLQRRANT